MNYERPQERAVSAALLRWAPQIAGLPIEPLGEGWFLWAYLAGDYVLRFPRVVAGRTQLALESRLLPELSRHVTTRLPDIEVYCDDAALPFTAHRLIPGVPAMSSARTPAASFGRDLGRFMHELHAFPVERAIELGVPLRDGPTQRIRRRRQYEDVVRRVFPLVSPEARAAVDAAYERYLGDEANFTYEPRLVHQDLDSNVLIDSETGELTGVIDFGAVVVGSAAMDLWLAVYGFERCGIASQAQECLEAAGVTDSDFERLRPELEFIDFRWPLLDILHGIETTDNAAVKQGVKDLEAHAGSLRA